ncbi:hypothetical protein F4824DRAFT_500966 [Ustulina deusta]|nr:hypothetical protein F4824DRAFT_506792 [Ustulina deusta]KAI3335348.1 hypothetical protein F4824DRAFT_500966 [Ustulina deusta]
MDDPWNWDIERVIQELCSSNRTWIRIPSPELPPSDLLEACLREQGADGHTILTYPDEPELCDSLGIKTLKQKSTFRHARSQLRQQSQMYQYYLGNYSASEAKLTANAQNIDLSTCGPFPSALAPAPTATATVMAVAPLDVAGPSTASRKPRRVAPNPLSSGVNIDRTLSSSSAIVSLDESGQGADNSTICQPTKAYLGPGVVSQFDLIHAEPTEVELESHDENEINISYAKIPPWQRLQAHKHFKRHLLRAQRRSGRIARNRADIIARAHDSEDDDILPLYGDSDDDADPETWEEVQDEQRATRICHRKPTGLTNEAANHIIDEAILNYIDDWKQRKLPILSRKANMLWKHARRHGQQGAINKIHDEIRLLEGRRAKLREGILSQQWRSVSELQAIVQALEPTIVEEQAARWRLGVLRSIKEPDELPKMPENTKTKLRPVQPTKDEEDGETLTSESECGQDGSGIEGLNGRLNAHHRVQYQQPIVILDDKPEVHEKGLAMSGHTSFQAESTRSIGNLAAHQGLATGFSTGGKDNGALVSSPKFEPITDTCQDDHGLHSIERMDEEDHGQCRVKRRKLTQEMEEIEPPDGNDKPNIEFGGRHANRHITEDEWTSVCKMFQCPTTITSLKPRGFDIEIAPYQLHAIWWMLTQQPVRDIQGGCLGDAMGLGKTVEVLSTFATFAMIKANHEEVVEFWEHGVVRDGRRHLPQEQTKDHDHCPSQLESPYPTECTCVQSGDTYEIATGMPSLPTICVVPPTAMRFWAAEFRKVLDATHPIAGLLRLSVWHNDYSKDQQLYHGKDRVKLTAGTAVRQFNSKGEELCLVAGRPGLSN